MTVQARCYTHPRAETDAVLTRGGGWIDVAVGFEMAIGTTRRCVWNIVSGVNVELESVRSGESGCSDGHAMVFGLLVRVFSELPKCQPFWPVLTWCAIYRYAINIVNSRNEKCHNASSTICRVRGDRWTYLDRGSRDIQAFPSSRDQICKSIGDLWARYCRYYPYFARKDDQRRKVKLGK